MVVGAKRSFRKFKKINVHYQQETYLESFASTTKGRVHNFHKTTPTPRVSLRQLITTARHQLHLYPGQHDLVQRRQQPAHLGTANATLPICATHEECQREPAWIAQLWTFPVKLTKATCDHLHRHRSHCGEQGCVRQ